MAKPYLGKPCLLATILTIGLGAAGCSVTLPIMGWSSFEDEPVAARTTSSLAAPIVISPLSQKLTPTLPRDVAARSNPGLPRNLANSRDLGFSRDLGSEDLRRANGALALALDPQGNGKNVTWENSQSGIKGMITPLGSPFLKADEICRDFMALTALQTGAISQKGTACRLSGEEWAIKAMEPKKKS